MSIKWYGKGVKFKVKKMAWDGLVRASVRLTNTIKNGLTEKVGPPASKPGEFPAIRTGTLRQSIFRQEAPEIETIRVGSMGVPYARWLEQGTRNMKRRPWLSLGLAKAKAAMKAELRRVRSARK